MIYADNLTLSELEVRNRLLSAAGHGLLSGDRRQLIGNVLYDLRVLLRLAAAYVDYDLVKLRGLHYRLVAEFLEKRGSNGFFIEILHSCHCFFSYLTAGF